MIVDEELTTFIDDVELTVAKAKEYLKDKHKKRKKSYTANEFFEVCQFYLLGKIKNKETFLRIYYYEDRRDYYETRYKTKDYKAIRPIWNKLK